MKTHFDLQSIQFFIAFSCLIGVIIIVSSKTSVSFLEFEFTCFQEVRGRHVHGLSLRIIIEDSNKLGVYYSTIDGYLALHEFYKGLPHFVYPLYIFHHQSSAIRRCILSKFLLNRHIFFITIRLSLLRYDKGFFCVVRSNLSNEVFLGYEITCSAVSTLCKCHLSRIRLKFI